MRKEIALKWADALESGEYKQTTGRLKGFEDDFEYVSYCCLGVLCELAIKDGVDLIVKRELGYTAFLFDGECSSLPESVMNWAGASSRTCVVGDAPGSKKCGDRKSLVGMNDNGASFKEIAAIIRERYEEI